MDYQVIPEKSVEDKVRKKSVVIRLFVEADGLPTIEQVLEKHSLFLQDPFDLDAGIPYYNPQRLVQVETKYE